MISIRNTKGEFTPMIAAIIIAVSMILAVALFLAGIEIQVMGIRNAVKAELASLSIKISDDTYQSLREGDFEAYRDKLNSSSSYISALTSDFYSSLEENIKLHTETYDIENVSLAFTNAGNSLVYTFNCDVRFRVTILGGAFPEITRNVTIEGRHNAKY